MYIFSAGSTFVGPGTSVVFCAPHPSAFPIPIPFPSPVWRLIAGHSCPSALANCGHCVVWVEANPASPIAASQRSTARKAAQPRCSLERLHSRPNVPLASPGKHEAA